MTKFIIMLAPLLLIYFGLIIYCIIDLLKEETKVKGDKKVLWLLVIVLLNTIGPIIYILFGREK